MTKEEANIIWNGMDEVQRKEAEEKFEKKRDELLQWKAVQTKEVIQKIKDEGRWINGVLDGRYPELDELNKEYKQQFNGLLDVLLEYDKRIGNN